MIELTTILKKIAEIRFFEKSIWNFFLHILIYLLNFY